MLTWIILGIIAVICIVLHPIQKTLSLSFERDETKWGNFETFVSIVGYEDRDIDLTFSLHPQYVSFQLSLWFVACGFMWSLYGTHLDCERDQGNTKAIELLEKTLKSQIPTQTREAIVKYLKEKRNESKEL